MKAMRFRHIGLFVGLVVLCTILSGCGDKSTGADTETANNAAKPPAPTTTVPGAKAKPMLAPPPP